VGLVLVSPGLVGVLYGLSNVTKDGGFARTDVWLPALAGIALLVAFVLTQLRRPAGGLIDIALLKNRSVSASSAVLFLSGAALYGSMFLLPLYFQVVRGTDALTAGLLLISQGVGTFASRSLAGRFTDTIGARAVSICGFVVMGLATIPFALADAGTNQWWLIAVLFVRGLGNGAVMIPVMAVAYVGLSREQIPHATIIIRLVQQLGAAFGTAILAVILEAAAGTASTTAGYAAAFDTAFWWAVGFTVVAVGICLILPARPSAPAPAPAPLAESEDEVAA
jgi:MFS family permease